MNFVEGLPIFTNWNGNSYNLILVIIDRLTKMVPYEPVKVTIDTPGLVQVNLNVMMW